MKWRPWWHVDSKDPWRRANHQWKVPMVGVNSFGASAPGPVVMREFGFTSEHVVEIAKTVLKSIRGDSHGKESG